MLLDLTTEEGVSALHTVDIEPSQLLLSLFPTEERVTPAACAASLMSSRAAAAPVKEKPSSSTSWDDGSFKSPDFHAPGRQHPYAATNDHMLAAAATSHMPAAATNGFHKPAAANGFHTPADVNSHMPPLNGLPFVRQQPTALKHAAALRHTTAPPLPPGPAPGAVAAGVFAGQRMWWPSWQGGKPKVMTILPAAENGVPAPADAATAGGAEEDDDMPFEELLHTLQSSGSDDSDSDTVGSSVTGSNAAAAGNGAHAGRGAARQPPSGMRSCAASPAPAPAARQAVKSLSPKLRPYEPHRASPAPSPRPAAATGLLLASSDFGGSDDDDASTEQLLADIMAANNITQGNNDGPSEVTSADAEMQLVDSGGSGKGSEEKGKQLEANELVLSMSAYCAFTPGDVGPGGSLGSGPGVVPGKQLFTHGAMLSEASINGSGGPNSNAASRPASATSMPGSQCGHSCRCRRCSASPQQLAALAARHAAWDDCTGWPPRPGKPASTVAASSSGGGSTQRPPSAAEAMYSLAGSGGGSRQAGRPGSSGGSSASGPPSSPGSATDESQDGGGAWKDA